MKQGFTLIEIVLVVLVLAIVVGVAVPNIAKSLNTVELSQCAQDMLMTMRFAQARSRLEQKDYRLVFDDGFKAYHLERAVADEPLDDQYNMEFIPLAGRWGRKQTVPSSMTIGSNKQLVQFYADGTIEPVRMELFNDKRKFILSTMEQRGHVFLWEQT